MEKNVGWNGKRDKKVKEYENLFDWGIITDVEDKYWRNDDVVVDEGKENWRML